MNSAEHISAQVRFLTERDQITRTQLVEIIEQLLEPWLGAHPEPDHFLAVNDKICRLLRNS
jgi:hypothetical protein